MPRVGTRCTAAEIIEHCRPQLASYKIPRAVEFVDDLPKTSTGKILRRALADIVAIAAIEGTHMVDFNSDYRMTIDGRAAPTTRTFEAYNPATQGRDRRRS